MLLLHAVGTLSRCRLLLASPGLACQGYTYSTGQEVKVFVSLSPALHCSSLMSSYYPAAVPVPCATESPGGWHVALCWHYSVAVVADGNGRGRKGEEILVLSAAQIIKF